jgi:hypothetical protein
MPPRRKRAARLRRCRGLLVRVALDHGGVDVEHRTRPVPATGRAGRQGQVPAGIGAQQPGPFPGLCAGVADPRQRGIVDRVQHRHAVAVDATGPDTVGWSRSTRQVTDRFAAVGEHPRQIGEHPSRVVTRTAHPQPASASDTAAGTRPRRRRRRAAGRGRANDTLTVSGRRDLRTGRCSLHQRSASPARWSGTSARPQSPAGQALPCVQRPCHATMIRSLPQDRGSAGLAYVREVWSTMSSRAANFNRSG